MSNLLTMILVIGGTFAAGAILLYFSLMLGAVRLNKAKRDEAIETTALMAAARDPDAGSVPRGER